MASTVENIAAERDRADTALERVDTTCWGASLPFAVDLIEGQVVVTAIANNAIARGDVIIYSRALRSDDDGRRGDAWGSGD